MDSNKKIKREKVHFLFKSLQSSWKTYYRQEADLIASTISNNSSEHYPPKFQAIRVQKETNLSMLSGNSEYILPISLLTYAGTSKV